MARVDGHIGRELLDEVLKGAYECPMVASWQVGASDAHAKEIVAGEKYVLLLAIETEAARRVPRAWDGLEFMGAEAYDGIVGEGFAGRTCGARHGVTSKDGAHLAFGVVEKRQLVHMTTCSKAIALVDEGGTEEVVEMGMCEQMGHRTQLVQVDIVGDGGLLFVVESTAVNDDGFVAVVAHDVAVFAKRINGKILGNYHYNEGEFTVARTRLFLS